MIIYQAEDQGCAYSIDSEGTLFYTPVSESGAIRLDDWVDVDFNSIDEEYIQEAKDAHEKLISMMKAIGEYFKNQ